MFQTFLSLLERLGLKRPDPKGNVVVEFRDYVRRKDELQKKYAGRRLLEHELKALSVRERIMICSCDLQIPEPCDVDPNCPVHWDCT